MNAESPTKAQERRYRKRASTLEDKAIELFRMIEEECGEDHILTSLASGAMTSCVELSSALSELQEPSNG